MRSNDEIIDIINNLKEEKGLSLSELARRVNMAKSALSRYFNKTRQFPLNRVEDFADVLGVSSEFILGFDADSNKNDITDIYNELKPLRQKKVYTYAEQQLEEQNNNIVEFPKKLPIVGKTAANPSILEYGDVNVEQGSFEHIPEGADCAILIQGDSMGPLIKDGEIVFYRRQEDIENGEIAIVEINGDGVTCKKVYFNIEEETILLKSINEKYQDREISDEDIRIVGKVLLK
ncbi:LexA family transcriptional regulator [Carnobacterium divergens]|uniref:LexA family transcriptional regulator n=2 Tax=Carnobacterium divergens TaxID=2748 RepID=A0AAW8RC03_CARDV|nr:LexA family transcriptional regulator [Carnobacterium divergens]MDT1974410.1 LexA family transcriptional regulator [Carnobacterium divergens]